MRSLRQTVLLLAACLAPLPSSAAPPVGEFIVYVGAYTQKKSKGIYAWRFDAANGKLTSLGLAAETTNPSFLALRTDRRFLYAVSEISSFEGRKTGAVSAFAVDLETGKLKFLNKVASRGTGPCFVAVDRTGRNVLVANYGSGSIAVLPIKEDGSLAEASASIQHSGSSVNPRRQQGPHAHSINLSPDNRFAIAADLGLDKLLVYRFDSARGSLEPNNPPFATVKPGAGPRHFAFHPEKPYGYVINELASTVTAFSWNSEKGVFKEVQTVSTLPKGFSGESTCAEIQVHPSGKFLYGSNRGHDSIAVFSIGAKGALKPIEHVSTQGKVPRNFAIDPTGRWLFAANQNSGTVVVFRLDPKTGRLTPAGQTLEVASPVCVRFAAVR